ncbi:MAG: biotin--[acetyl-CoA-carboxylase] ligase [Gammaproteobacteria bacterium]|nr:biotin--[acetyl-CoA-carboxylase] ligase [Gammaproteobacteria bacterium]
MGLDAEVDIDRFDSEALEAGLISRGFDEFSLLYKEITESTNADVLALHQMRRQQSIAICEMQTAGKGRRGRQWLSPFAKNIYCTIGIEKSLPPAQLGLVSILSGIGLCQALATCGLAGIKLKWPNDLYFENQKLGGILIESQPVANTDYFFAVGFGINVHMTKAELAEIPQAATSIELISDVAVNRQRILLAAIEAVIEKIRNFSPQSVMNLVAEFAQYDAFYGQSVSVLEAGKGIRGIDAGINESGQLIVDTDTGRQVFSAAEISLRAAD